MGHIEEEVPGSFRDSSPMPGHRSPSPSIASASTSASVNSEPTKEMSYVEITAELAVLMHAANEGATFDENRLDFLLQKQLESPEYRQMQSNELSKWRAAHIEFLSKSLEIARSFVPSTVFTDSLESLQSYGLSADLSKRILQKQGLWLVRLDPVAISRLHESDLYHRYQPSLLDVTELAAVYAVLPEVFMNDSMGKKLEWKENIYTSLKRMLADRDAGCLPKGKLRAPCYEAYFAAGAAAPAMSPVGAGGIVVPDMFSPLNSPPTPGTVTSVFEKLALSDADDAAVLAAAAAAASAPTLASRHRRNTVGTCSSGSAVSLMEKKGADAALEISQDGSASEAHTRVPFSSGGDTKPENAQGVILPRLGFGPITDLTTLHKADVIKGRRQLRRC